MQVMIVFRHSSNFTKKEVEAVAKKTKEPRIIGKIKREVAKDMAKGQHKPISGDTGCSSPSSSIYCTG